MSHLQERKEKVCLNCQAAIHGRYCHICGQENIEPRESFWHLVTHFMYDITHFDGKFFSTLRYLLFRPGHLSHEYLRGRRSDYLHPIRMYVFTSAFFFLVFFTLNKEDEVLKLNETQPSAAAIIAKLEKSRSSLQKKLDDTTSGIPRATLNEVLLYTDSDLALIRRDTTAKDKLKTRRTDFNVFGSSKGDFRSVASYDSLQEKLPPEKRDNFINRRFTRQKIHLDEKYNHDGKSIWTAILNKFRHLFPQMLFVSLPLFALGLQLLYFRKKDFLYVNHVVFTIHLYCGTFIIILVGITADYLLKLAGSTGWAAGIFTIAGFLYWYKSMRNFYEQRRGKTILKYFLVMVMALLIMMLLFTIFFIFSAMTI